MLAALDHPQIASIYGLEEAEGRKLLVMQLAAGETLQERMDFLYAPERLEERFRFFETLTLPGIAGIILHKLAEAAQARGLTVLHQLGAVEVVHIDGGQTFLAGLTVLIAPGAHHPLVDKAQVVFGVIHARIQQQRDFVELPIRRPGVLGSGRQGKTIALAPQPFFAVRPAPKFTHPVAVDTRG